MGLNGTQKTRIYAPHEGKNQPETPETSQQIFPTQARSIGAKIRPVDRVGATAALKTLLNAALFGSWIGRF
jgi:hypothetical protein